MGRLERFDTNLSELITVETNWVRMWFVFVHDFIYRFQELEQYWGDKRIFRIGIYKSSSVRIYRVFDKFINELVLSWIETNTAEVWMQFYFC
jgi:hypothetical protein